jgi:quercetin dioxygenase-like cupin family protein
MKVSRAGTRPTLTDFGEAVTGYGWVEELHTSPAPARARLACATFGPKGRTAWHSHPLGQAILIVHGVARVGSGDGTVVRCTPGDVVWFDPGERHWHGADASGTMIQLNLQEADEEGAFIEFYEPVSDREYDAAERS